MKKITVRARADGGAEVLIYDPIGREFFGDGIDARQFREALQSVKADRVTLRVNSPGGSVTEGAAMLSHIDDWKRKGRTVEAVVDGLAASAASFVMMGASRITVASNALVMIHDPHTVAMGTAEEMRAAAGLLDKVREQILDAYERHSKVGREKLSDWMKAETWFTGAEAVDAGLAHEAGAPVSVAAFAGARELLARLGARKAPIPDEADRRAAEETAKRRELAARL